MKIVYLAPIAFSELKQRPQYFAETLSAYHKVYYIEPTIRIMAHYMYGFSCKAERYQVNKNLAVYRCDGSLVLPYRWNIFDPLHLNGIYEYTQLKRLFDHADVIIVAYEGWYNVVDKVKNKTLVYDKMDENTLLTKGWTNKAFMRNCERALLAKCSCALVSSKYFARKLSGKLPTYLIPNAYDRSNTGCLEMKKSTHGKKIYGYVGTIAEWFDNKAIETIAEERNHTVILVGPCTAKKIQKENVIYIGRVEKSRALEYIKKFDVCLYPFKRNELLRTINPVKIYEYLAFNKPVLAVSCEETARFEANIYLYRNQEELRRYCKQDLMPPFHSIHEYEAYIENNSWESRTVKINKVLEKFVR